MSSLVTYLILAAKDQMSKVVASASNSSIASLQNFSSKANQISNKAFSVSAQSGVVSAAILAPLGMTIKAAEESEKANKRLINVFKTMGEVNDNAARQSAEFADQLQHKIGIEDEEIMMVQAKIATFKRASDEAARLSGVFDRTTQAAFDMSAGGFGEASQNAVQLGKALQNPALGAQALAKAGAINKEDMPMIKMLQATKGVAAAQQYVLSAIERQFKGQAANIALSSDKIKIKFADVTETLGARLMPNFVKASEVIVELIDRFNAWSKANPQTLETIMKVVAGVGVAASVISGLSFGLGIITKAVYLFSTALTFLSANPVGLAIAAVAGTVYLFYKAFQKSIGPMKESWNLLKKAFGDGVNYILSLPILKPVKMIIDNWDKIKWFFSTLWDFVKTKFVAFFDFVVSLPSKMYDAGANIVKSIWEGIKSMASKPVEAIKNIVSKVRDYLPFSPAKVGPLRDIHRIRLVETIAESIKPNALTKAMKITTAAALVATTPVIGNNTKSNTFNGGSSGFVLNYNPTINLNGSSVNSVEDFKKVLKDHKSELLKMIAEAQRLSNRTTL